MKEAPEKNIHPSVDDSEKNFACRAQSKRGKSETTSSCAKELIAEVCGILDRLYSDTIFKQKLLDFLVMLISLENVI